MEMTSLTCRTEEEGIETVLLTVLLPASVRKVEVLDLGQDTEYSQGFLAFTQSLQGRKVTDMTMGKSGSDPWQQECPGQFWGQLRPLFNDLR